MCMENNQVLIIGGGLAGSEAAYYLASHGIKTTLVDMKPKKFTPAHESEHFAELVCSNSLKSNDVYANACGLLKEEMRILGSLIIQAADETKVAAGAALAVDRDKFSAYITEKLQTCPNLTIRSEEVLALPETEKDGGMYLMIATGPLTSDALSADICEKFGGNLHFFDASAPIVSAESVDMEKAFTGDRYGKGTGDYINCPMNKEEYYAFVDELLNAERAHLHTFEKGEIFEGCMPVEVMASRGRDTLRFGTLKPVGLADETGKRPYAVLQLRKENENGTAYNLVGFQTNLKFGEQKRVFSMIPGLEQAEFLRYGVMHRNTFLDGPRLLNADFSLRTNPLIRFAGQMTGVEGYMESAASGLMAGLQLARFLEEKAPFVFPEETIMGALCRHISASESADYQPMGAAMGMLPPLTERIKGKRERYAVLAQRSLDALEKAIEQEMPL